MTDELRGRAAIVTGGGRNIGRAVAVAFARAGARVVVASRRRANLVETARRIGVLGGECLAVATDVTDPDQVSDLVERTVDRFGTVDVIAALAGGGSVPVPIDDLEPADWNRVLGVNLTGAFLCARAVVPILRANDSGAILFCTGGGAFHPVPGQHLLAYACAKAALCRLTDQLTAELWETGIRVHCLDPGLVWDDDARRRAEEEERRTGEPHPLRERARSAEDAAELALWLCSARSAPLRGRLVSVYDSWWRDPERVRRVHETVHLYRLRRVEE
jgi:3-oxoacyl-[acyl-carrier protein] reductase